MEVMPDFGMIRDSYEKAVEIDPNFIFAWNNKGTAYLALEKYNEAKDAFDKALRDNKYIISRISVPIFNVIENYHK
jgi:tetratricopeptide (TPR) repeat protein